ncbi:peptidase M23 [Micromonospora sp. NPDC049799]|uniref:peptidase M23 n=1 Tax=Micromonospora sp. NPDC049799 TaxID=3154741 RepID=UPI00340B63D0
MPDANSLDDHRTHGAAADRSDDTPSSVRSNTLGAYTRNLLRGPGRVRIALAAGLVCCLGLTAVAQTRDEAAADAARIDAAAAPIERAEPDAASRDHDRSAKDPKASPVAPSTAAADPDVRPAPTKKPKPKPTVVAPVAGLDRAQMRNAQAIVRTGQKMDMPRRALVIAVATAMQESTLYNYASGVLPESQNYPHQAIGWDHDSVGLFQQRPSSGWGEVGELMDPAFATRQFLSALAQVPGWQQMRLTDAAQAVQVSAFPEHYAQHEWRAAEVVDAVLDAGR